MANGELSLSATARAMPFDERASVIASLPESPDLHKLLKHLIELKLPGALVEVTHGAREYGKDLVAVDSDGLGERVVAFVVKSGNVGGKTKGVVDEIVSQVSQATLHPAKLKSLNEDKTVTQVFVVIAGQLSSNARTRIQREVRGIVQDIWDIKKLVDDLTEVYPQVFFDSVALDFLQRRILELETAHPLFSKFAGNRTLSEWFVDPFVITFDQPDVKPSDHKSPRLHTSTYSYIKLKDVIAESQRILLLGAAGAGKSAVVAKLTIDMMKDALSKATSERQPHEPIFVPILVAAKRFLGYETVRDLLDHQFAGAENAEHFRVSMLLVDGLDEAPAENRTAIVDRASAFSRELKSSLVITSRWIEAVSEPLAALRRVELLEFKFNQAMKLFEKIVPDDENLLKALRLGLDRIKGQVQMSPLSLVLLVEVVREFKEIPASVTELYDQYFDYALGRHDRQKDIEVMFAYQIKKAFLGELAFECFFARGELEVDRTTFDMFVQQFAKRQGYDHEKFRQFLEEIDRANILRIGTTVQFAHRSFLDYFVAYHIQRLPLELHDLRQMILDSYFTPLWQDVAFFYVGLKRELDPTLLESIFAREGDDLSVQLAKIMCGRLLQAGWMSPLAVKVQGIEAACALAPIMRDHFVREMEDEKVVGLSALGDHIIAAIGTIAYSSTWLADANQAVLQSLLSAPSGEGLCGALMVLGGLKDRLEEGEYEELLSSSVQAVDGSRLEPKAKGRLLFALMYLGNENTDLTKAIDRRLRRLFTRHPGLADALIPRPKKRLRQAIRDESRRNKD